MWWRPAALGAGVVALAALVAVPVYMWTAPRGVLGVPFATLVSGVARMMCGLFLGLAVSLLTTLHAGAFWVAFLGAGLTMLVIETTLAVTLVQRIDRGANLL